MDYKSAKPNVSIIIPVKNGSKTLAQCLQSVLNSDYNNFEIIVVDDHSNDDSVEIAKKYVCKVFKLEKSVGANSARNYGAKNSDGEILIFIDSDIVINYNTVSLIVEAIQKEGFDAVVGVYTAKHRNENLVSQYKNLWIRYSYIKSPAAIDWLFGSISGIRKVAFEKVGGFDVNLLAHKGSDDIELGKRFAQANLKIVLKPEIEVEHLKNYKLWTFIKNEFHRSSGFAELALQLGEAAHSIKHGFVNVYPTFVISTIVSIIFFIMIALSFSKQISYWYPAIALLIYFLLNIRFLNFLEHTRGLFAMFAMIPIMLLDHLVCFIGSIFGLLKGFCLKNNYL